ncbi:hypothetical protein [Nostoc sp. TCL26-01]|uniref:hypothetical protein n=1 Tax=Nostoc sp. TCL26-01 TaxID=2576904 RepID=UPI0015BF5D32|nr:hypothetical protein [Nostoc sp. TCL26-01]QLE57798.1 hypothetical protein FD725_21135 [Nostoc sp. TCL26-01]
MSVWRKYNLIISLSIALLMTGCIEDKASQCQRLIQVVNAGNSLIEQNKGQQVITSFQLSKDLEAITTSLKELNLTDPNLQDLQSRFAKVFQNLSQAIAKASRALGMAKTAEASSTGREKLQKARSEIDTVLTSAAKTAGKESDMLVEELNKYCVQPQ